MAPMYYRGAAAAVLVYDVTSATSFEDLKGWVKGKACIVRPVIRAYRPLPS